MATKKEIAAEERAEERREEKREQAREDRAEVKREAKEKLERSAAEIHAENLFLAKHIRESLRAFEYTGTHNEIIAHVEKLIENLT